jgi:hypothetical protein
MERDLWEYTVKMVNANIDRHKENCRAGNEPK